MSTWAQVNETIIERCVDSWPLKTRKTRLTYRRELIAFHRFTTELNHEGILTEEALAAWVKNRAAQIPLARVIDRVGAINRFLDALVRDGLLLVNPLAAIRERYGQRRIAPIVRAWPVPISTRVSPSGRRRHGEAHLEL